MRVELVAPDKIAEALAKEFLGVDADRKKILLQHVEHAFRRGVELELHDNFSKNLPDAERAFYSAIVVVHQDQQPAASAASPSAAAPQSEAPGETEGAEAARAEEARTRSRK